MHSGWMCGYHVYDCIFNSRWIWGNIKEKMIYILKWNNIKFRIVKELRIINIEEAVASVMIKSLMQLPLLR